jgi:hypothetical protein
VKNGREYPELGHFSDVNILASVRFAPKAVAHNFTAMDINSCGCRNETGRVGGAGLGILASICRKDRQIQI